MRLFITCVLATVCLLVLGNAQSSGDYDLSWWTIDSGGVTWTQSAFGTLLAGGTVGQPDASEYLVDASNQYALRGGFWYRPVCFLANGDVDGNGCVDDADLLSVLFAFGSQGPNVADSNCDGVVDDADLLEVLFNFGSGC